MVKLWFIVVVAILVQETNKITSSCGSRIKPWYLDDGFSTDMLKLKINIGLKINI